MRSTARVGAAGEAVGREARENGRRSLSEQATGSEILRVGKHAAIYGVGIVISKLAGFLLLPVYTRMLTPADYGILELLTTTIDLIGTIAGIGLASGVFKFYAEQRDETHRRLVVSTAEFGLVGLALVAASAGFAASPQLTRTVLGEDVPTLYFRLFFGIYLLSSANTIPLLYVRALRRSVLFVAFSVGKLLLTVGLTIYFVVLRELGVLGVLLAGLIAEACFTAVLVAFQVRRAGLGFSLPLFRRLVRFGAPMVLWFIGNFVVVFSDRYFLKHYTTMTQVGLYSLAYKFVGVLHAFGARPFFLVWSPQRFEIVHRPDAEQLFRRVFRYFTLALGSVGLLLVLLGDEVLELMADPAFHSAYALIPLLIVAQILYYWVSYSNLGLYLNERSGLMAGAAGITSAVVIGLNFLLIPRFGAFGAAWASVLAYAVRYALILRWAQREYRIDHGWDRIGHLFLILGGATALHYLIPDGPLGFDLAASLLLALGAGVVLYARYLSPGERDVVRRAATRPRRFLARVVGA